MRIKNLTPVFLLSATAILLIWSCKSKSSDKPAATADTGQLVKSAKTTIDTASIKLVCKELPKDSFDIPYYNVYLSVDGKETLIKKVNGCQEITKASYGQYHIPKEAIMACGGWYAGAGDYYYLVIRNGKPVVFEGWQDEGQEDDGYHWTEKQLP